MNDIKHRKVGYYKVCHPYSMNEEAIGFWDGTYWKFYDDKKFTFPDNSTFDDDELQWIDETWYVKLNQCREKNCKAVATKDYNGHGHLVCDYHYDKLNDEFDEEYR